MPEFKIEQAKGLLRAPGVGDSKYSRGVVGLVTGSERYPGAAVLGVQGAARAGAGYIRYFGPERCQNVILNSRPEVVFGSVDELAESKADCWVIGSGIANMLDDDRMPEVFKLLSLASAETNPQNGIPFFVIDAGALEWFAQISRAPDRKVPDEVLAHCVITPHTGEMSRIIQIVTGQIVHWTQVAKESEMWAKKVADALGCTVLLKGATTVIAPSMSVAEPFTVTSSSHWLATAGTGDVLSGLLGTIIAQGRSQLAGEHSRIRLRESLLRFAAFGVYLHARSAQIASGIHQSGDIGHPIAALDVAEHIPDAIEEILRDAQS